MFRLVTTQLAKKAGRNDERSACQKRWLRRDLLLEGDFLLALLEAVGELFHPIAGTICRKASFLSRFLFFAKFEPNSFPVTDFFFETRFDLMFGLFKESDAFGMDAMEMFGKQMLGNVILDISLPVSAHPLGI